MRIVFISVSDELGGSEIALVDMMAGLRRLQPSWTIGLVLPGDGPLLARAEAAGADCTIVPLPRALARVGEFGMAASSWLPVSAGSHTAVYSARLLAAAAAVPSYLLELRRAIRAYQPSIVHTNGFKAHVLGARAAGAAKLVWHMHEYVGDRAVSRKLLAAHAGRPSAVLANSVSVANDVRRALPTVVPPTVLYNAVDLAAFVPGGAIENLDARAGLAPANGSVVRVGLIATFARWKGHEVFLRAIAALPSSLPVRGYVIGEPLYTTAGSQYDLEELRRLAAALGVAGRVGFTGYLPAAAAMRALDVVVHASTRPEPFGLVIAEAMACGRATVVSAAGGAAELVEPEMDALTHAPGDDVELARQIARLAGDADLRRTLGERAHATARRRFDSNRLATELAQIYERLS
jgi:glycosyltransferase involved in cell wall biosynthesis